MTDLPPGPELDALVAEAMGRETRFVYSRRRARMVWEMVYGDGVWRPLPAYSTSGNGMLAMLEWVRAQDRRTVGRFVNAMANQANAAGMNLSWWFLVVGGTPHAVAWGVLAAVKVEKETK